VKVILRKEVEKLGNTGEVVTVKDGYARNFLIPKGLALRATTGTVKAIEVEKAQAKVRLEKEKKASEDVAKQIESLNVVVKVKAGEEGRIFGSVTSQMVADALKANRVEIDKRRILLDETIKALGSYKVSVKLHPEVTATLTVEVAAE
jgi:large subunit ribosomal protein L9